MRHAPCAMPHAPCPMRHAINVRAQYDYCYITPLLPVAAFAVFVMET
jgi:hypothetical protein